MNAEENNIPITLTTFKKHKDNKYKKLIEFGNNYKCIMNRVNKDLTTFEDTKKKQIALILKMMDECNFRVEMNAMQKKINPLEYAL